MKVGMVYVRFFSNKINRTVYWMDGMRSFTKKRAGTHKWVVRNLVVKSAGIPCMWSYRDQ